ALYGRPVILWVEDALTSDYFAACWQNDHHIDILIAGGSHGIRSVVNASRQDGHTHVFEFVDRDMVSDNMACWFNGAWNPVFVPAVHEVENYLLDAVPLAGWALNTAGRSDAAIEARLQARAGQLVWHMACRRVLAALDAEITRDFPKHAFVATLDEAE